MSDLKKQLIKLGTTNPELRPHIRKVLANTSSYGDVLSDFQAMAKHKSLPHWIILAFEKTLGEVAAFGFKNDQFDFKVQKKGSRIEGTCTFTLAVTMEENWRNSGQSFFITQFPDVIQHYNKKIGAQVTKNLRDFANKQGFSSVASGVIKVAPIKVGLWPADKKAQVTGVISLHAEYAL